MSVPIIASGIGADEEFVMSSWLYPDGATVSEGDPVAEIMVEKSSYEIRAPATGCLRIALPVDEVGKPGAALGYIERSPTVV